MAISPSADGVTSGRAAGGEAAECHQPQRPGARPVRQHRLASGAANQETQRAQQHRPENQSDQPTHVCRGGHRRIGQIRPTNLAPHQVELGISDIRIAGIRRCRTRLGTALHRDDVGINVRKPVEPIEQVDDFDEDDFDDDFDDDFEEEFDDDDEYNAQEEELAEDVDDLDEEEFDED